MVPAAPHTEHRPSLASSVALVVGAGLAFAVSGPLARHARPAHPLTIVCGRVALAALILLLIDARGILEAARRMTTRQRAAVAFTGLLLAAHFTLFVWGLATTSLPAAVTLISLEPVSVVLVAFFVHGSRPGRLESIGLLLATAGAVLVGRGAGTGEHRLLGDLLVVGAVVLYGFYVAAARSLRDALPPRPYAALVYLGAALFSALALPLVADEPGALRWPLEAHSTIAIVLLALIPTLGGHTAVQMAARKAPPALVAMVSPGETVGAILIGALWLDAIPSRDEVLGACVIVAGVVVAIIGTTRAAPPRAADPADTASVTVAAIESARREC